jgi:hypothetical protein
LQHWDVGLRCGRLFYPRIFYAAQKKTFKDLLKRLSQRDVKRDAPKRGAKGGIAAVADGFRAGLDCAGLATRSCVLRL